jgi:hypothetical protein
MGLFKQMKDMKTVVAATPGLIDQAQQLQANAAALQGSQGNAYLGAGVPGGSMAPGTVDEATLAPINGISLDEYARIAKTIGEQRLDQAGTEALVQRVGHSVADWQGAYDGWNERFKGNTALSVQFGVIYQNARSY